MGTESSKILDGPAASQAVAPCVLVRLTRNLYIPLSRSISVALFD